ncbi:unnamed protein product, partial [Oppiella nova]
LNFGVITCESCRTFFRRSATRAQEYVCFFNNKCVVNQLTRKFCKKCRIEKCFAMGMRKELTRYNNTGTVNCLSSDATNNDHFTESMILYISDSNETIVNPMASILRDLIFNFNELEMNRLKQLFTSTAYMRDPVVKITSKVDTYTDTSYEGCHRIRDRLATVVNPLVAFLLKNIRHDSQARAPKLGPMVTIKYFRGERSR